MWDWGVTWIQLVNQCMSTTQYEVVQGGRVMNPIILIRDIYQDDLISPYVSNLS